MNRLVIAPPFPRGVRGDNSLISFTTHLGLLYELAILKGSREILPQVGVLILECWLYRGYGAQTPLLTEIADWLLPFGFRLWDIGETYRSENDVLATLDCLFVNTQIGLAPSWFY